MLDPAPDVVAMVAVAGTLTVMLSDSSPLNVTAPADELVEATVAVAPFVIVPNASGAVADAVIGVTIVAELVTLADWATAFMLRATVRATRAASARSLVFMVEVQVMRLKKRVDGRVQLPG
jgi:hypothetical protein